MKIEINEDGTVTIDGKVMVEQQSDAVAAPTKTKLQEARERYPVGTKVKSMCTDKVEIISEYNCCDKINDERNIYLTYNNWAGGVLSVKVYDTSTDTWAEIVTEPLHPTIEDIYDSVKPIFWVDSNGVIEESSYHVYSRCKDSVATKEDAEYILATMQLINIANYYNAKYPSENRTTSKIHIGEDYYEFGWVRFSLSAAKEALSNPNVGEVLQKYFRIK